MSNQIKYKAGYRYHVVEDYHHEIRLPVKGLVQCGPFLECDRSGLLVKTGYASDGPTNAPHVKGAMRATIGAHDPLYQLIRAGILPMSFRPLADEEMLCVSVEDRMNAVLASAFFLGVRAFGEKYAEKESINSVIISP